MNNNDNFEIPKKKDENEVVPENNTVNNNLFDVPDQSATKTIDTINDLTVPETPAFEQSAATPVQPVVNPTPISVPPVAGQSMSVDDTAFRATPVEQTVPTEPVVPVAEPTLSIPPQAAMQTEMPTTNDVQLEKKLVVEQPTTTKEEGNSKKGKIVVNILVTLLIIAILGSGVYYLATQGIISIPGVTTTTTTTTATTTTTTTEAAVSLNYGNYTSTDTLYTLAMNEDGTFSTNFTGTQASGTYTFDENTLVVLTFSDATSITAAYDSTAQTIQFTYNDTRYVFTYEA